MSAWSAALGRQAAGVRSRARARCTARTVAMLGGALVGLGLLVGLLYEASVHTFSGNSDGGTVVLEGQAMSAGHLTLQGWALTLESFWSVDAVVYALAIRVGGMRPALLHLVPVLIALAFVVLGALLARRGRRGAAALAGAATVIALLALPSPALAFFLLQGPWHVCTALWCLIAFAALTGRRSLLGSAVAVVFLAAGLLGDFMTIGIGIVPVALAGLATMARRRWRAGALLALAAPAAAVLAVGGRLLVQAVGTFALVNRNVVISRSQIGINIHELPRRLVGLLGVGDLPGIDVASQSFAASFVHALGTVAVAGAFGYALFDLARGVLSRRAPAADARLDDLLLFASIGSVATFVFTAPSSNTDFLRYLAPTLLFAAVLTGRRVAALVDALPGGARRVALGTIAALTLAFTLDATLYLRTPTPRPEVAQLSAFLQAHQLTEGIGDYWSSSLVTASTGGAATVRPLGANGAGKLVRYDRQSSARWYAGRNFQFFVYDTGRPWRNVNGAAAVATFGTPAHTYDVGTYRVLVWPHPLTISPQLAPTPNPLRFYFRI